MAQERRVLLANGQYITIVQTTGTSSGDVMSQSAVTAALSTKSDVGHTHNASAITGGTFGTNMIADGAITKAKLGSDISLPSASYEIVKVSGLTTGGTAAIGADVMIGGASYKFDSTGVVSVQIPYGQIYKIQAYSNDAWLCSYNATYTANASLRSISIIYNGVSNGVFIEAIDGMLYTSSNWNSNKTANSIVVISDSARFRMALEPSSSFMQMSTNHYEPLDAYMTAISNQTAARADYDGVGNTANILKVQPSTKYAAGYCNAFIFPDGNTKGFLPSLGQLYLVYQNKEAVSAALRTCGGTAMSINYYYWSSTFYGLDGDYRICWQLDLGNGNAYERHNLGNYFYVCPFAAY